MEPGRVLDKLRALCAKQERCRSELRQKLEAWGVAPDEYDRLLHCLEEEGFLSERRFAEHFAVSKLRQNGWGRVKIRAALEQKELAEGDIEAGLAAIDEDEYRTKLEELIAKAGPREGIARTLTGRGFEEDLIEKALSD